MKKVKKLTMVMAVFAVLAIGVGPAFAVPIPNGNFDGGNTQFNSSYTYNTTFPGANAPGEGLWDEGTYGVGTDPSAYHSLWASFGDHTTGTGNMMIVNGDTVAGVNVWSVPMSGTIDVLPNTQYYFSAWLTSVYPPPVGSPPTSPANLAFSINSTQIGSDFTLSGAVGTWQQFYVGWFSGANITAQLSLINGNTVAQGNDFAVDDIELETTPPDQVPEPTTMLLLGLGLVGLVGVRRKIQK